MTEPAVTGDSVGVRSGGTVVGDAAGVALLPALGAGVATGRCAIAEPLGARNVGGRAAEGAGVGLGAGAGAGVLATGAGRTAGEAGACAGRGAGAAATGTTATGCAGGGA